MLDSFAFEALPLCAVAFLAGFIDAIVGGGGLIQLPALFIFAPHLEHATIFGTNKLSSISGASVATAQYARRFEMNWRVALWTASVAFVFSFLGARAVSLVPKDWIRPVVFALLVAIGIYVAMNKSFGATPSPKLTGKKALLGAAALGAGVGFYDGFFGPGTGSFLIVAFIGLFGYDFLRASAAAKTVNFATNLAALCYFAPSGNVALGLGVAMGAFNVLGAMWGARLATLKGSAFVRGMFLLVIAAMILKFAYDSFVAT